EKGQEGRRVEEAVEMLRLLRPSEKIAEDALAALHEEIRQGADVSPVDVLRAERFPKVADLIALAVHVMGGGYQMAGVDRADGRPAMDVEGAVARLQRQHGADVVENARFIGAARAASRQDKGQLALARLRHDIFILTRNAGIPK